MHKHWPKFTRLAAMAACCIALLLTGCKHLEVSDRWYDSDRVADVPSEILPIWTDTVLHQPGKPGVRGFGGRIYFYESGKPDPVRVEGQVVVYAFDGESSHPNKVAPLRKYVITPDQLATHHSPSSLGNSYSIWVPWDRVGGEGKALSLVVRFDGSNGGTTLSKPSRMLLPGVDVPKTPLDLENGEGVQLASHESDVDEQQESNLDALKRDGRSNLAGPQFETASIDLPPSFQRRLFASTLGSPNEGDRRLSLLENVEHEPVETQAIQKSDHWEPLRTDHLRTDQLRTQRRHQQTWGSSRASSQAAKTTDSMAPGAVQSMTESVSGYPATNSPRSARFALQRLQARTTPRVPRSPFAPRSQQRPSRSPSDPQDAMSNDWTTRSVPGLPIPASVDSPFEMPLN